MDMEGDAGNVHAVAPDGWSECEQDLWLLDFSAVISAMCEYYGGSSVARYTIAHKLWDALMCKEGGAGRGCGIFRSIHLITI